MKILIKTAPPRRVLRWAQRVLFAVAILLLGYSGFVLVDTWIFQSRESAALERFVPERPATGVNSTAGLPASSVAVGPGGLIGRIGIPRLDVSAIVVEGTSNKALRRAVGHIAGTALPGQAGNVGIAGHRDTFFRPLRKIQQNDIITLTTLRGEYRYRVVSTKVVSPDDVAVLNPDGTEILTLVTCYPFYFVGPAPDRFIVRAARVI
jgi:sortase A